MPKVFSLVRLAAALIAAGALFSLLRTSGQAEHGSAEQQVRNAFAAYKRAVLSDDGQSAARLLNQGTIEWYGQLQQLALHGSEEKVRQLSPIEKIQVLSFRHRISAEELRKMSPRDLIAYSISHGWVRKQALHQSDIGEIEVAGDVALAHMRFRDKPTNEAYRFVKQNGGWRFDQLPILRSWAERMGAVAQHARQEEDRFIIGLLENASHKKTSPDIWKPPFPEEEAAGSRQ